MTQADKVELARVIINASGGVLLMLALVGAALWATLRRPKQPKEQTDMAKQAEKMSAKDVARILAENERLTQDLARAQQSKGTGALSFKVSEKGACSVYGLGRFPVTLYQEQWERLLADSAVRELKAFITANSGKLSRKS